MLVDPSGAQPKPVVPPHSIPSPGPGNCDVSICCRPLQSRGGGWVPFQHCYVLVTDFNRQQIYYGGEEGGPPPGIPKGPNCLVGYAGALGQGQEQNVNNQDVCTSLGAAFPCAGPTSIHNCLAGIINWFNTPPYLPYSLLSCNSNMLAWTLINACVGAPPASPPIYPGKTGLQISSGLTPPLPTTITIVGPAPAWGPLSPPAKPRPVGTPTQRPPIN